MRRAMGMLFVTGALLVMAACAESLHQGQRIGPQRAHWNGGDLEAPSDWQRPGGWWNPFGYYGSGAGWDGGGSRAGSQQSSAPAAGPTPPTSAPPQFQKKY